MEYKLPNLKFLPWFTVAVVGPNVTRSPTIFTITIIFCRHVTNFTSRYKISPIIFTITIIFCRHVTNVTNVTSCYKISLIIFSMSIIFCRHVTNVTSGYIMLQDLPHTGLKSASQRNNIFLHPKTF